MRFAAIFLSVFTLLAQTCVLAPSFAHAQAGAATTPATASPVAASPVAADAATHFDFGIAAFKKNDFESARAAFERSLAIDETNPVVLFNLGLTLERAGKLGPAIASWRKALFHSPGYAPARDAIRWSQAKLERAQIPHEVEFWETFRSVMLVEVSLEIYLAMTSLLFFLSGWLFLAYAGQRRRSMLDEKPLPPVPWIAALFAALCSAGLILSAAKAYDDSVERGTIVEKKIEVRSTPDASGTQLFDLYEGLEVVVRQSKGDWSQVTYPGGSTGWIPRKALSTTLDRMAR